MKQPSAETVRELPEGWREDEEWFDWRRADGLFMVDYVEPFGCSRDEGQPYTAWRRSGPHMWVAAFKGASDFPTAIAAMEALDREYPLGAAEHGEK